MNSDKQHKRSKGIHLPKMKKQFMLKPLSVGVAGIFLSGCGDEEEVRIFANAQDCASTYPDRVAECETAYQNAVQEAQRTAPKYNSMSDCEGEFGPNQCTRLNNNSGSFFMPFMAGYMLSNMLDSRRYYSQPMFTSYSPYSSMRYRWIDAGGYDYGDLRRKKMKVNRKAFQAKPAVTRTISRGGFGSSVRAKSSWGSSKGGWGG